MITELTRVDDLPEIDYHADPALSSSGARTLTKTCPAVFKWEREHPAIPKDALERGAAAHTLVLGVGPDLVEIPEEMLAVNGAVSTKAAKDFAANVRAAGKIPLTPPAYREVHAMAAALIADPIASKLLVPGYGKPEVSLFWRDTVAGIMRRARYDWLPVVRDDGRLILVDYKTSVSADPRRFDKTAMDFGYHQQADWYRDGARAHGLDPDPAFLFVIQEKSPPYLVSTVELAPYALRIGAHLNRQAITTFAECEESGRWPGYTDTVEMVRLPAWYESRFEEII